MKKEYASKYHQLEQEHWWFKGRRNLILSLLKNKDISSNILDIGCSSGTLLRELNDKGFRNLVGIDIDKEAISLAQQKKLKVYNMNAQEIKFDSNTFDIIIASDVLEHIENETKALNEWKRILKPSGEIIMFVPAFMFLWRKHDEENQHKKRYTKKTLFSLLESSNFKIKKISYWNLSSFFPLLSLKILGMHSDNLQKTNMVINAFLSKVMILENVISKKIGLPFGVSIYAVVRKLEEGKV